MSGSGDSQKLIEDAPEAASAALDLLASPPSSGQVDKSYYLALTPVGHQARGDTGTFQVPRSTNSFTDLANSHIDVTVRVLKPSGGLL